MKKQKWFLILAGALAIAAFAGCSDLVNNLEGKTKDSGSETTDTNITVGGRSVLIRDSDTGASVSNARITVRDSGGRTVAAITTDSSGIATFPEDTDLSNGTYTFVIERDGYIQTTDSLSVSEGNITTGNQISIPKTSAEDCIKIILDWSSTPSDLDAHLVMGSNHIYFAAKSADNGNMLLDRDDTNSYGPETITIKNVNTAATYKYYVHNYSQQNATTSTGLSASQARVRLYINNQYKETYTVPTGKQGIWWHVFDITGGMNVNTVSNIATTMS